jgi:hypothetical protein
MPTNNERLDAIMERHNVEPRATDCPIKEGKKRNMCAGGDGFLGQRFPVTLYATSWVWLLREENIEAMIEFLEDNGDRLSWAKQVVK